MGVLRWEIGTKTPARPFRKNREIPAKLFGTKRKKATRGKEKQRVQRLSLPKSNSDATVLLRPVGSSLLLASCHSYLTRPTYGTSSEDQKRLEESRVPKRDGLQPTSVLATSGFLLLVVRPGAAGSFLLLVAMPFAPSSLQPDRFRIFGRLQLSLT